VEETTVIGALPAGETKGKFLFSEVIDESDAQYRGN
jgi:hypothetical protein